MLLCYSWSFVSDFSSLLFVLFHIYVICVLWIIYSRVCSASLIVVSSSMPWFVSKMPCVLVKMILLYGSAAIANRRTFSITSFGMGNCWFLFDSEGLRNNILLVYFHLSVGLLILMSWGLINCSPLCALVHRFQIWFYHAFDNVWLDTLLRSYCWLLSVCHCFVGSF